MATISVAATGGSETTSNATVNYASQPHDWYVAFIFNKGGVSSMTTGWTRFSSNYTSYTTEGWGSCFYLNDVNGVNGTFIDSGFPSGFLSYVILRIRPDADKRIVLRAGNTASFVFSNPSIAVPGELTAQSVIIGGHCVNNDSYFSDSDTTDGTWTSVAYHTSSGADRAVAAQGKIVTGSSPQTYGGTSGPVSFITALNFSEVNMGYWGVRA